MKLKSNLLIGFLCISYHTSAQIPVEVLVGNKKTSLDLMFFKYFKNKEGQQSKWLFFNRNRAVVDYGMTENTNLPQFGFTEAFSYNHPSLKGFAPVGVVQITNKGIYPKMGLQYVKLKKELTVFSWLAGELLLSPNIDFFLLVRYTPDLNGKWNLFSQAELVNTFPTVTAQRYSFTQRFRLGLKHREVAFGLGTDIVSIGRGDYVTTYNIGGFIRYEF